MLQGLLYNSKFQSQDKPIKYRCQLIFIRQLAAVCAFTAGNTVALIDSLSLSALLSLD